MNIQHKEDGKGIFYVAEEKGTLAELVYSKTGNDTLTIQHTEVSDTLRGKNIGYLLVNAAAAYARENHLKISSRCTFATAIFNKKKAEFEDVLKGN